MDAWATIMGGAPAPRVPADATPPPDPTNLQSPQADPLARGARVPPLGLNQPAPAAPAAAAPAAAAPAAAAPATGAGAAAAGAAAPPRASGSPAKGLLSLLLMSLPQAPHPSVSACVCAGVGVHAWRRAYVPEFQRGK
jgi:hypothetical protein